MIILTRLNGEQFAVNCDLVERVDAHPNTVLTLVDGTKYIVAESPRRGRRACAGLPRRRPRPQRRDDRTGLPVDDAAAGRCRSASLRLVNHPDEG